MSMAFAPKELPFAPRPIATEVLSSWLLRVAAANHVPLRDLLQGFASRYGPVLTNVPIDYALPEDAITALSSFCRVAQKTIRTLDICQRLPHVKPALLLRFQKADPFCPRHTLHRIRYAFCPRCLTGQRVIHVRWDWSVACLIRCAIHRAPLLDGCPVCGEADPLTFAAGLELIPSPLCRSCGNDLRAAADSPDSIKQENEIQAVEDAYREVLQGIAPRLIHKATDRAFRLFVEDVLSLLTRSLNTSTMSWTGTVPFSRQDILQIIAALIANAAPGSDACAQRKHYARGLHLWATLLSIIPEHEGQTIEQASVLWPLALRRRFLSALYYRIRKRWPFPPYRAAKHLGRPVERIELASVYGLRTISNAQSAILMLYSAVRPRFKCHESTIALEIHDLSPARHQAQIVRQAFDDPGAPSILLLPNQNVFPNPPIEQNQLAVHAERSPELCCLDTSLEIRQEFGVPDRNGWSDFIHRALLTPSDQLFLFLEG